MVRFLLALLALLSSVAIASGQTAARTPATGPAGPRVLDPEELKALHREAVELMKAGQFPKAGEKLEKVYNAIPRPRQDRALVLNHAILDMVQGKYVMRGLRDLSEYLNRNRGEDEEATNILGATLNIAASNSKVKAGALWQAAFKEWDRRNYLLDHSRPGYHRWGAKWISDEEYNTLEDKRKKVNEEIAAQIDGIDRAAWRVSSLNQQYNNAREDRDRFYYLNSYVDQTRGFNAAQLQGALQASQGHPELAVAVAIEAAAQRQAADANLQRQIEAWRSTHEAGADLLAAVGDLQAENGRLNRLVGERDRIRPEWPRRADPMDPDAPPPAPTTQPAPANVPATQPTVDPDPSPRPSPLDLYSQPLPKH